MQQQQTPAPRNPIARSFCAGINRPQVARDRTKDRRLKHKRPFWDGEE